MDSESETVNLLRQIIAETQGELRQTARACERLKRNVTAFERDTEESENAYIQEMQNLKEKITQLEERLKKKQDKRK